MSSLLTQLGFSSFSTLYTATPASDGEETVTSSDDANSEVSPTIDTEIEDSPYNFILGTTGGANDSTAVSDGTAATEPIDDGDPEYSLPDAPSDLGSDAYTTPADLDPSTFEAWTQSQQLEYMNYWNMTSAVIGASVDSTGAIAVTVSGGQVVSTSLQTIAASIASDLDAGAAASPSSPPSDLGADGAIDPADLDPSVFASWTQSQQQEYMNYWNISAGVIGSNVDSGANALYVSVDSSGDVTSTTLQDYLLTLDMSLDSDGLSLDASAATSMSEGAPSDLGSNGSIDPADLVFSHRHLNPI